MDHNARSMEIVVVGQFDMITGSRTPEFRAPTPELEPGPQPKEGYPRGKFALSETDPA